MVWQQLQLLLLAVAAGALLGLSFCLYDGLLRRKRWYHDLLWWWFSALPLLMLWLQLWRGSFRAQIYLWLLLGFAAVLIFGHRRLTAWVRRQKAALRLPKLHRCRSFCRKNVHKYRQKADIAADRILSSRCSFLTALRGRVAGILKKNFFKKNINL